MPEEKIRAIVAKHRGTLGEVLNILCDIQQTFGCISEPSLRLVSELTGRSMVDLFGVASFNPSFRLLAKPSRGADRTA